MLLFIQQGQGACLADPEALKVVELGLLGVGVVEADEQHGDHFAGRIPHRCVLGHVGAVEQHRPADITLPGQQALIGRMLVVQGRTDGAAAILFGQGCADTDKVFTAAHKYRGHAAGRVLEFVDLAEIVVQQVAAQEQARGLYAGHGYRLLATHTQPGAEALFKQPAQTLGTLAQGAVEGVELVGEQARLAGQVFLARFKVGGIEGTQGENSAAADDDSQDYGQGEA